MFHLHSMGRALLSILLIANQVKSQLPSSSPAVYPGMPSTPYGPDWQSYFLQNKSDPALSSAIPFINDIGRMFSGSVSVNRANHPNNTLFFWAIEHEADSLTASAVTASSGLRPGMSTTIAQSTGDADAPWLIWLNGGPGSSSLLGLLQENGPFIIQDDGSFKQNPYSWDKLVDIIYVDQPVGVGFATADSEGYVADENQVATDFIGFLSNLVEVFPSLRTRPLYLAGESYAGMYIPYIIREVLSSSTSPVNLAGISIGDGTYSYFSVFEHAAAIQVLETFPMMISYDTEVFDIFKSFAHNCEFDFNLTYPQKSSIPLKPFKEPTDPNSIYFVSENPFPEMAKKKSMMKQQSLGRFLAKRSERRALLTKDPRSRALAESELRRDAAREMKKREWTEILENHKPTSGNSQDAGAEFLTTNTIDGLDPWYGCDLTFMIFDYATNFSTEAWATIPNAYVTEDGVNIYDIPDITNPKANTNPMVNLPETFFPNSDAIRTAIHAPTETWQESISYPFGSVENGQDPSIPPMDFFDELADLTAKKNMKMMFLSGNDDGLVPHFGTEVFIQNVTFGGTRGFTRKPSTPLLNDDGSFAGIIHQERNWIYALLQDASHQIPQTKPQTSFMLVRDFLLGNSTTGLVEVTKSGSTSVVGGEDSTLALPYLTEPAVVYLGSISTQTTVSYATATVEAFYAHVTASNA